MLRGSYGASISIGKAVTDKPSSAAGYDAAYTRLVRATCLYVATKLGELLDDLVVIGGLVPSLLIEQDELRDGVDAHVGTMDLDMGLTVSLLGDGRYRTLTERLRGAGFKQDANEQGNPTRQRWKIEKGEKVSVDFLIPPSRPDDRGGALRNIEPEFAAIIAPGLHHPEAGFPGARRRRPAPCRRVPLRGAERRDTGRCRGIHRAASCSLRLKP